MFRAIITWYRKWNDELLDVLADPSLVQTIADPRRRKFAQQLADLSAIERMQIREFSLKYKGATLWTAVAKLTLFFSVCGLGFLLFKPNLNPWMMLAIANVLGWSMIVSLLGVWFNYRQIKSSRIRMVSKIVIGMVLGALTGAGLDSLIFGHPLFDRMLSIGPLVLKVALVCALAFVVMVGLVASWRNQAYEMMNAQLELEAEREKNARQQSETQLRILRAQIEPHFLFNTLGAVQQLAEQGAPQAAELTRNLIVFLRASISEIRSERVSLQDEFRMIEAYLKVMQVRMAHRLTFELDLPEDLGQIEVPSMLLLTLAENAIKHGLEPSIAGGKIEIKASREGSDVVLAVKDSGVGLSDEPGNGLGLQNVRDRLHLMFGERASFEIAENLEGGVGAEIRLQDFAEPKVK